MRNKILIAFVLILFVEPIHVWAGDYSPLQLSFFPDLQLVSKEKDIKGLRLNLPVGKNQNVYGLDLGVWGSASDLIGINLSVFGNYTSGNHGGPAENKFAAIQIAGLLNMYDSGILGLLNTDDPFPFNNFQVRMKGIQIAGLGNHTGSGSITGIQIGGLYNAWIQDMHGLQMSGFLNVASDAHGIQVSSINGSNKLIGVQWGAFNIAGSVTGLQFGLINLATDLNGLQIGFVNYVKNNRLPVLPIINFTFKTDKRIFEQ